MKLKLIIGFLIFCVALIFAPGAAAQNVDAIISIDSVDAQRGEQVAVPVMLSNNNLDIAGLSIPVKFPNSMLLLDSVSFNGSLLTSEFNGVIDTISYDNMVKITYLPLVNNEAPAVLPSQNGLIATIHFTVDIAASPGYQTLDTLNNVIQIGEITAEIDVLQMSGSDGQQVLYPHFEAGGVFVKVSTGIDDFNNDVLPNQFALNQNYPNPFNPTTTISFSLPTADNVKLVVFNVLGQKVNTLVEGRLSAGYHEVSFDASDQPSGIFFYRLSYSDGTLTKKMLLVK